MSNNEGQKDWEIKDGYVSDSITAVEIAKVIFVRVYGEKIMDRSPFNAVLKDGNIWVVEGTLEAGLEGGVPYIEIQKSDCKILKVTHGK